MAKSRHSANWVFVLIRVENQKNMLWNSMSTFKRVGSDNLLRHLDSCIPPGVTIPRLTRLAAHALLAKENVR